MLWAVYSLGRKYKSNLSFCWLREKDVIGGGRELCHETGKGIILKTDFIMTNILIMVG